jgi:glucokinase
MLDPVIIGVDLGGTQMRAASLDSTLNIDQRIAEPTLAFEGPDRVVPRLLETIARVMPEDESRVLGIGVSAPGPINPRTGVIVAPPNLPGWHNVPLRKIIQERFGASTFLGNDANVAALAETTLGAAKGYKHVIYLTISTGIGGGVIDEGHLIIGAEGLGAECGHMIMVVNGKITDLEKEAAGPAIARKAVERIKTGEPSRIIDMVNGDLTQVTAKIVGDAAADGDPLAVDAIRNAGYMIGLGIVSLMHLFNPEIVVIGGGVTHTGDLLFAPMHDAIKEYTMDPSYHENVPIVPAALGDNVALIGAAALVTTRGGSSL